MKKVLHIIPAAILAAVSGCNTSGCLDNRSAIPLAGIYSSETGEAISVSGVEISGVGAPNDSVLAASGSIGQVYLPMRSTATTTTWCFHYTQEGLDASEMNDTVSFGYTSEPYFASEECGAMYIYNITSVRYTTHLMDSVIVTDSLITNTDIERIKIYFRTQTTEEPDTPDNPDTPDDSGSQNS